MTLIERLRERTIAVPKPGTKAFRPTGPITSTFGGPPKKPGDDAGLQSVSHYSTTPNDWWVQEHIVAGEPLCYEAADRIAALEAALREYMQWRPAEQGSPLDRMARAALETDTKPQASNGEKHGN